MNKCNLIGLQFTDLAITSAQSCPKHLALFFDELASVFVTRNKERLDYQINGPFLTWLMTLISEYFEMNFVVVELPATSAQWQLDILCALNTQEEIQNTESESVTPIAINIAGTLLNPSGRYKLLKRKRAAQICLLNFNNFFSKLILVHWIQLRF